VSDGDARVQEEVLAAFGALLEDRDVGGAHALEGGALEVQRRGRRERLEAGVDDALWQALRDAGAADGPIAIEVGQHRVRAAPVSGAKILLHLEKAPAAHVRLIDLVDEGLVPEAGAQEVLRVAQAGNGLLVVGAARSAARRLVIAIARELAEHAPVMSLDDLHADWLLPTPQLPGGVAARARAAVDLGAEALLASRLSLPDAIMLAREQLPVPIVGAVDAAGYAALHAAFAKAEGSPSVDSVASQVCVVGRVSSGRAALLEQHAPDVGGPPAAVGALTAGAGPLPGAQPAPQPSLGEPRAREPDAVVTPAALPPASILSPSAPLTQPTELPPLPPLGDGPPAHWASQSESEDPGWELGDAAGGDGVVAYEGAHGEEQQLSGFAGVLNKVKDRPTFKPRPPAAHPQTRQLQEEMLPESDPLGGLTLEPPGGTLPEPDEEAEESDADSESDR
jgi:hypothetical protein